MGVVAALQPLLFCAIAVWGASEASADPDLPIRWRVDASTHLARLNLDVTVPRGQFTGSVDLGTGELVGDLSLPPAVVRLTAAGLLPLSDATFVMEQAQPITGHVDFATLQVTTTAHFNIRVTSVRPVLTPSVNLVGDNCRTSEPLSVTMSGPVDLAAGSTFTGTYAIPPLVDCTLLLTPVLNLLIAGDGNTLTASFSPPPPPVAQAGADLTVDSGSTFTLDASQSSDPEDRPITFLWTQIGGPAAVLTNEDAAQPTVTAPNGPATLVFRVTVTNSDEVSDTDEVTVTVRPK
jgi:hypothetical protein